MHGDVHAGEAMKVCVLTQNPFSCIMVSHKGGKPAKRYATKEA